MSGRIARASRAAGARPGRGRRGAEDGFALAVALLALVGLTALASAGFLISQTDYRVTQSHRAGVTAFYIADAGLSHHLSRGRLWGDTQSYAFPSGRTRVWETRLLDVDEKSALYLVNAEGSHAPPEGGAALRRFGFVALHHAAPFALNSAITAAGGLEKEGVAGTVSGYDAASAADCPIGGTRDTTGLAVPPGAFQMNGGKGGGGGAPPGFYGVPPIDHGRSALELLYATGIQWQSVLDGTYAEADYLVSRDGYPDFSALDAGEWPVIRVDRGTYSMSPVQSGRGTLIVDGDLTFNGNVRWDGVVLVGGALTSNGQQDIRGAVVAGLNLLLGQSVGRSSLGNGTWEYRYHSCAIEAALKAFGTLIEEPGTWFEEM